jgi:transposase-like protein
MSKAQLVITAVVLEGRSKSDVARDYGLSRYWVHQLVKRYEAEGAAAFQPRSRRPHTKANKAITQATGYIDELGTQIGEDVTEIILLIEEAVAGRCPEEAA